jgi:hypothetical protein
MAKVFQDTLVRALASRFADVGFRLGAPSEPAAIFAGKHDDVGDATVSAPVVNASPIGDVASATVAIGKVLCDEFFNFDVHLAAEERAVRLANDVVRFLEHLFADRLLFWQSADSQRVRGWRECADARLAEPLVTDDRTYDVYFWSGPLPQWRATTAILERRAIRDERDYQILLARLEDRGEGGLHGSAGLLAKHLISQYERGRI